MALELARAAYAKNGVAASLVKKMEVGNLTATDLDRDGKAELVGSFRVRRGAGDDFSAHTLFMIFEPEGMCFKPALVWFHKAGEEGSEEGRDLIDQLDIDGDGVAEVVVAGSYYESPVPQLGRTLLYGVGVGLRYYTAFGPLRLDVATPLRRRNVTPAAAKRRSAVS